ncbi:Uncharacterised protein [Vibrio cholerae]|nr:Uncharacterised protein [Vibrio cholerae]
MVYPTLTLHEHLMQTRSPPAVRPQSHRLKHQIPVDRSRVGYSCNAYHYSE